MRRIHITSEAYARTLFGRGDFDVGSALRIDESKQEVSGYPVVPSRILTVGSRGKIFIWTRTRPRWSTSWSHDPGARARSPVPPFCWAEEADLEVDLDSRQSGPPTFLAFSYCRHGTVGHLLTVRVNSSLENI